MKEITTDTSREQLAAIVVAKLAEHNISAILVGGSVVSMYTNNEYDSRDLDFVSPADHQRITVAMVELGFDPDGRNFYHPAAQYSVEFPSTQLGIGEEEPVIPEGRKEIDGVVITMLSPTQSIMDRLAGFYHWNDRQNLDQAVMIYNAQRDAVSLEKIEKWSRGERAEDKYKVFLNRLKK
jgi:hypothetical protein